MRGNQRRRRIEETETLEEPAGTPKEDSSVPGDRAHSSVQLPIRRWVENEGLERTADQVAVEATVEVAVNGVLIARLQCLPQDLEDLAVGFLLAEGMVEDPELIKDAVFTADGPRVDVELDGVDAEELASRAGAMALASGCGKAPFNTEVRRRMAEEPVRGFSVEEILSAVRHLQKRSDLFRRTGCVHAAAAWRDGDCSAFREDLGRHNAVDKVAGALARTGRSMRGCLLVSTGRLSAEIAAKSVRLGVWGLASRAAPTDKAIQLAAEFGMVLGGFARGRRLNVYCGAEKLRT